jgi:methionyl aminopeptidase
LQISKTLLIVAVRITLQLRVSFPSRKHRDLSFQLANYHGIVLMLQLRSNREILKMRKAGEVVWHALQAAQAVIKPGVTTREIDAEVEKVFAAHQAQPLFKGVPGKVPFPAATCISVNEQVVHGIPGNRKLKAGDIVSVDTGCRVEGWCGDSAWTYPVGDISPAMQQLLDVTRRTLEMAIELVGKKQLWSQVAAELASFVESHRFSVVENYCGHGLGREMHEEPQFPNYVNKKLLENDIPLKTGLVMAIEPMVNFGNKATRVLADHWTVVANDGKPSAHFEHTIALTSDGPMILTAAPDSHV